VIGLPGEVVEIKDGKVYIDGSPTPLDDSFIPEKMIGSYGPYTVPETVISCLVTTGMIRRIHVHGKTNSCDLTSLWGKLL